MATSNLPLTIEVTGFPLLFRGWNNTYHKVDNNTYRMNSYSMWRVLGIVGVTVMRTHDGWVMNSDNSMGDVSRKLTSEQQDDPVGSWEGNIEVNWGSITVSGLPFMLQGWNKKFLGYSDGSYRLSSYSFYGVLSIIGVKIIKRGGVWVMIDEYGKIQITKTGSDQTSPVGKWSQSAKVKWS